MRMLYLGWFLLSALTGFASTASTALPDAVTRKMVAITPVAGGLGLNNISCRLKNTSPHEVRIQIPPGLHFQAGDPGAQDLFTVKQELIVLKPNAEQTVKLTGYCMNTSRFSPRENSVYIFKGYATPSLRTLGDSLSRYQPLADNYAQMFVWAMTNHREMFDFEVEKQYLRPATNIMNFVARAARVPAVKVTVYDPAKVKSSVPGSISMPRPSVNVFSKRAILAFHNPTDQIATFKVFDDKGKVKHVLFENKRIRHGLTEYTFGINDIVRPGTSQVYYAKVMNSAGKVLAEMKVDKDTEEVKINPLTKDFVFSFSLDKGVKRASLNIYLEDGTLVENFKRYEYLPVGHYNLSMSVKHLFPKDTKFVTKLIGEDGVVYARDPEAKK